jgi:hypothetical protein
MTKKYEELLNNPFVKKNANINDLVGEYMMICKGHCSGTLELHKKDIIQIDDEKGHALGTCCKNSSNEKLQGIRLYASNDLRLRYLPFFPIHEPIYTFVLHPNGVIRFRINENMPAIYKILFAYNDSTGIIDLVSNLYHVSKNGCFCFGLLTQDNNIIRYNRWNDDCELFATFLKIHD